jgi:tRNA U34 2-thiouridine synthase MnmA/TrmU
MYDIEKHSDLYTCIQNNGIDIKNFKLLAELLSEHHDEGNYYWILKDLDTNKYYCYSGSHDYTGWDCASSAHLSSPIDNLNQFQLIVEEFDNQNRPVRQILWDQLKVEEYKEHFDEIVK